MLDVSQATHLLTSLGVSSSVAARASERAAQQQGSGEADPLSFLKALESTLAELSAGAAQGDTATPTAESATTKAAAAAPAPSTTASKPPASQAAKAPFTNLQEFREWESKLGNTFAPDYQPPDYLRVAGLAMGGGNDTVVNRYLFFKNNPEFAQDYQSIRSGKLSKFPTDGSTLIKSDLSKMSTEASTFYKKNPDQLRLAEGFSMDPTLYKQMQDGKITAPEGSNRSEWLMDNKWTKDGPVAQNNRYVYANADYIGLDGKGAGTYRLARFDPATGNLINPDGQVFDPNTGEAQA